MSTDREDAGHSNRPRDGARARLFDLVNASWATQAVSVAVRLGIAERLRVHPCDASTLAGELGCHAPSLLRLMHGLVSLGLVERRAEASFALTESGMLLCADVPGSLAAWAALSGTSLWQSWGRLIDSVKTGKSARDLSGAGPGFAHLESDPELARLFNRAMGDLTRPVADELARALDFSGALRVVDVGGGAGVMMAAILAAWPDAQGVVFDMAHAVPQATELIGARGLRARCEVVAGSFFHAVPDGDVHVLKSILHDWDDRDCGRILAACARASRSGARLVVVERLAPERYGHSSRDQGIARSDLNMLVGPGGRERTQAEYRALCAEAGFDIVARHALPDAYGALEALRR